MHISVTDEKLDKVALKIISGLENVERKVDKSKGIKFLYVDVNEVSEISVSSVPSLVYFKSGEPFIYEGCTFMRSNFRVLNYLYG